MERLADFEKALTRRSETHLAAEASKAETETERDANLKNRFSLSDLIFQQLNPGAERGKPELEEARDFTNDQQNLGVTRQSNGLLIPHSRLGGVDAKNLASAERDLTTCSCVRGLTLSATT